MVLWRIPLQTPARTVDIDVMISAYVDDVKIQFCTKISARVYCYCLAASTVISEYLFHITNNRVQQQ